MGPGPPQELLRYIYDNSGYPATPLQAITPNQLSMFLVCHVFLITSILCFTNEERYVRSTNKTLFGVEFPTISHTYSYKVMHTNSENKKTVWTAYYCSTHKCTCTVPCILYNCCICFIMDISSGISNTSFSKVYVTTVHILINSGYLHFYILYMSKK